MNNNNFNSYFNTRAFHFPEFPSLDEGERSNLLSLMLLTERYLKMVVRTYPNDSNAREAQSLYETVTGSLLGGKDSVEEFLDSVCEDYLIDKADIPVIIEGEEASFICPMCRNQTVFPADIEHIKHILKEGALDACPYCNSDTISVKEKISHIIFGDNE